MVAFIIENTIYDTTNTKILIDSTPIICALKFASEFVNGTARVPQIPANMWAGIAPTTSSSLKLNNNLVPNTTIKPPIAPIKIAAKGVGANGSAVTATNPPIAPFNICTTSVLPYIYLVIVAAAITPPQAARLVLIKIPDTATASSNVPIAN